MIERRKDDIEKRENAMISVDIVDMTEEGEGIGKSDDGYTVFVKDALWGERVVAEITKDKGSYSIGKLNKVIEKSQWEQDHFCEYAHMCGGCPYGRLTHRGQNLLKAKQVLDKLKRMGGLCAEIEIDQVMEDEGGFYYRNKGTLYFGSKAFLSDEAAKANGFKLGSRERLIAGFLKGKSHELFDCRECKIQSEALNYVVEAIREYCKIIAGKVNQREPITIRYCTVRISRDSGEVMVIIGASNKRLPESDLLISLLAEKTENLKCSRFAEAFLSSVYLAVPISKKSKGRSRYKGNSFELKPKEEKLYHLAGNKTIIENICGLEFEVSPQSFFQVNPIMAEKLYEKALSYAKIQDCNVLLDLYCGVGTLGIIAAKRGAKKVIGIEQVKSAVLDANRNCVINNIVNSRYICGRAEDIIPKIVSGEHEYDDYFTCDNIDVALLDPPRAGCGRELLEAIGKAKTERIVYVSCNPSTLARDIKILGDMNYGVEKISICEMFFGSGHTEVVVSLKRNLG